MKGKKGGEKIHGEQRAYQWVVTSGVIMEGASKVSHVVQPQIRARFPLNTLQILAILEPFQLHP